MNADLGTVFLDGVAQFAGAFTNPLAAVAVVALGWLLRRPAMYRLAGCLLGFGLSLPAAWSAAGALDAVAHLAGGTLAVLLQVEFMLGVVLPVLAFVRRVVNGILGLFRSPTLPPGP
ncbi:MAG TPA: hypothetical protein PKA13_23525 [Geminicoccaceae bacterium]|nr:hypothetical protein [Geminicoccus sp.]HMU52768.1 hypothetical protein [Geminicoccaceae bacterium]